MKRRDFVRDVTVAGTVAGVLGMSAQGHCEETGKFASMEDLQKWLDEDLARFGANNMIEWEWLQETFPRRARITLWTKNFKYGIVAVEKTRHDAGTPYLGGSLSSREPDPGEDWLRGRDLSDGPFIRETWQRILADIVSWELVHP